MDLVALGTLGEQAARFLDAAVVSGLNVLVSGGTQEGMGKGWLWHRSVGTGRLRPRRENSAGSLTA